MALASGRACARARVRRCRIPRARCACANARLNVDTRLRGTPVDPVAPLFGVLKEYVHLIEEATTRKTLLDGWSLELPVRFSDAANPDGSWSGWDEEIAIDLVTVSTAGRKDGSALTAEEMLNDRTQRSHEYSLRDRGLVGCADLVEEADAG